MLQRGAFQRKVIKIYLLILIASDPSPRIQGDTLIDGVKVGLDNLTQREIHRTETPPTRRNSKDQIIVV